MKKFFLHEPKIGSYEKKEVLKCLNTGWISPGGENVRKFEKSQTIKVIIIEMAKNL